MNVAEKKAKLEELKAEALNKKLKEINDILDRIAKGKHTPQDISTLRQKILSMRVNGDNNIIKIGNVRINIGQGRDIRIDTGDRIIYQGEGENVKYQGEGENVKAILDVLVPMLTEIDSDLKKQIAQTQQIQAFKLQEKLKCQQEPERQKDVQRKRQKDVQRISVVQGSTQGVSNSQPVRVKL